MVALSLSGRRHLEWIEALRDENITQCFIDFLIFESLARPRSEGGMAILDPVFQHSALQLHWLLPLLGFDSSFALPILAHVLRTACDTPVASVPLVFPELRTHAAKQLDPFRAADMLGLQVDWSCIRSDVALSLQLQHICVHRGPRLSANELPRWSTLPVHSVYTLFP
ncbi:hypothetical protein VTP01DRAFT_5419 [Rhizomucor pusillus]|uniref:uncharacterized protein n=1 Tax=Rhizomucor pusillus TaxID=4840 RepID=UPI003743D20A